MPKVTFKFKRKTAPEWVSLNPVLAAGEPGLEIGSEPGTDRVKYGDGTTRWNDLKYSGSASTITMNDLFDHINDDTPHTAYDIDMQDLTTLFENGLA